eukprot:7431621-Alexandrium_andersonii.AAC.1
MGAMQEGRGMRQHRRACVLHPAPDQGQTRRSWRLVHRGRQLTTPSATSPEPRIIARKWQRCPRRSPAVNALH